MSVRDDPRDGAFDHGSMLAVVGDQGVVGPGSAGGDEFVVVPRDLESPTVLRCGASVMQGTVAAACPESDAAFRSEVTV